jgi:hypothetical protein
MLRRLLIVLVLVAPAVLIAPAASADPICIEKDAYSGACLVWAEDPDSGEDEGPGDGGDEGSETGGGRDGGGDGHLIIDGRPCLYVGLASPQPPKSFPVWEGHTDGAIHECYEGPCQRFCVPTTIQFWAADAPDAPPPPDPEDLAERAVDQMQLRAIDIGIVPEDAPGRIGVVGMPAWMWVADPGRNTLGPIEASASAGGFTVIARARVDRIVWDLGDGTTVECHGAGTPYEDRFGRQDSPDCGHTYTRQGEYTVLATSYWTVQWQGIGRDGQIPVELTQETSITVGEAHVIVQ